MSRPRRRGGLRALGALVVAGAATLTSANGADARPFVAYGPGSGDGRSVVRVLDDTSPLDRRLPDGTTGAAVSPDGASVAFAGTDPSGPTDDVGEPVPPRSWLRVAPVAGGPAAELSLDVADARLPAPSPAPLGTPTWAPDGRSLVVVLGDPFGDGPSLRVVCAVDARGCRPAGRTPTRALPFTGDRSDVLAWGTDGLLVGRRSAATPLAAHARCGAPPASLPGPTLTVRAHGSATFGPPLRLRAALDAIDGAAVLPGTAGVLPVADGTLAFETPGSRTALGRTRCGRRAFRWRRTSAIGTARVLVRRAGRTVVLPAPAGLRRGRGLWLVPDGAGGAFVVARGVASPPWPVTCPRRPGRPTDCHPDLMAGSGYSTFAISVTAGSSRTWRYRPGAAALTPVTGLPRVTRDALATAYGLGAGAPGVLLAESGVGLDRVPIDPVSVPTALVRRPLVGLAPLD